MVDSLPPIATSCAPAAQGGLPAAFPAAGVAGVAEAREGILLGGGDSWWKVRDDHEIFEGVMPVPQQAFVEVGKGSFNLIDAVDVVSHIVAGHAWVTDPCVDWG